jgi:hypothetical protein
VSPSDDRAFPCALTAVAGIAFDYADGDGVDCEPYDEFLSAEDTSHWLRGWTGNAGLDGNNFRVFGQDGAGGCVAFWRAPPGGALADQPVVLLGSEGELGVVAQDLASYLWLLSDGFSPWEAVESPERARVPARNCSPSLNGMPPEHADRQQRLLLQPGKSSLTSNKPLPRYADRPAPAVPGRRAETPEGLTGRLLFQHLHLPPTKRSVDRARPIGHRCRRPGRRRLVRTPPAAHFQFAGARQRWLWGALKQDFIQTGGGQW